MQSKPGMPVAAPVVQRLRLACVCAAITLLVFSQSSGEPAADTKLDLVVAPGRFLAGALRMWDPRAGAGQMQDQAYGYLFPMGPVFLLGRLAGLPPWIVQRGWESALLVAAFLGVVRLARLLGVPGFWPRVAAGLAYALAPRMLMEIGVISSELMPVAALPWVLVPLVRGARTGSPRRAAAKSGVALLFAGGVNAAATLAILPVPALWLLTRAAGPRRRALLLWWPAAAVAGCLWWAVPLLVLGRYSPPFLDWIESSEVTTGPTSLIAVLRGAEHWQAYLGPSEWPGAWILVAAPATILATAAVAALGLAGIARAATPHRIFLAACVVLGLVLVTLGHVATIGPPFAGSVRDLLDGPLNAFRNVHKFDPVLRLPLAIGVGQAVAALAHWWPERIGARFGPAANPLHGRTVVAMALAGIAAVAIAPALSGRLVPDTRTSDDPVWWAQTGDWLGAHAGRGRALVVPGAAQPVYIWGAPRDDALQPYADGPWTVRDAAPIAQPGYVRLLDAIEAGLATGADQPNLAPLLARAGIRYLVVRNDLDTARSNATPLRFVHSTIAASPGFRRAASFGRPPRVTNDPSRLLDLGLTTTRAAVDVYENTAWRGEVALLPAEGTVVANGSSDQLGPLLDAGLAPSTPVVFGKPPAALTAAGVPVRHVVTDGIRRREFGFGGIANYSQTLTAGQPFAVRRAAHDYLPADAGPLSTVAYSGITDVRASSSASDPTSILYRGAAYSPWAALDGDPATAWFSASLDGAVGQWLAIDLPSPVRVRTVRLQFAAGQPAYPTRLEIRTDSGSRTTDVAPTSRPQDVPVPSGPTQTIRVTVRAMSDPGSRVPVGIAQLDVPGVTPSRTLLVPFRGTPAELVFATTPGRRAACLPLGGAAACDPAWSARGEEDNLLSRTFRLASAATYSIRARVLLRPGSHTDALLDAFNPIRAIASSVQNRDPRERPGAAVDGDPRTAWVAAPRDKVPTLTIGMPAPHVVDGLQLTAAAHAPVSRPTRVLIHAGGRQFARAVPDSGRIAFPRPVRTHNVSITVLASTLRVSTDTVTGAGRLLPVGIADVRLVGAGIPAAAAPRTVTLGCSAGIAVQVDGTSVPLRVTGTAAAALAGRPLTATPCTTPATLAAGQHTVSLAAGRLATPQSITMTRVGTGTPLASDTTPAGRLAVRDWGATQRSVRVATSAAAFLAVRENANAGWRATLDGHALPAVTMDGWQQGWLLPAHADGVVQLTFTPQRAADWGLIAGALAALALLVGALVMARRDDRPPVSCGRPRRAVLLAGCGVALVLLGGLVGLVLAALGGAGIALAGRSARTVPAWAVAAPVALAGVAEAWAPAGSAHPLADSAGVQLLCLLGVLLLLTTLPSAAAPRPGEVAQQRAFEEVPGDRGGASRGQRGEQEQLDEMPAEGAPAQPALDRDQ